MQDRRQTSTIQKKSWNQAIQEHERRGKIRKRPWQKTRAIKTKPKGWSIEETENRKIDTGKSNQKKTLADDKAIKVSLQKVYNKGISQQQNTHSHT